jgi:competence protein ComEC
MRFADFPFLRYLPFFLLGIWVGQELSLPVRIVGVALGVIWVSYLVLLIHWKNSPRPFFSFLAYFLLFGIGIWISTFYQVLNKPLLDSSGKKIEKYLARVKRPDLAKPRSSENLLEIFGVKDSLEWKKTSGNVLVYHQSLKELLPGQILLVSKSPEKIPGPSFPDEFDYRRFLERKGIYFRQFIGKDFLILDSVPAPTLELKLWNLKKSLQRVIDQHLEFPESKQIASALLLGQKDSLDRDIRKAYSETGTMHILAVSGLHVGIIYALLVFPIQRLRVKPRYRKIYLLGVVLVIWVYALLTGFSPSVIRASTMFTLFSLGQMRARKPSVWNILAFSAMLMITLDPEVIHEVGFQLSYLAVAGIVGLQPLILRIWEPRHWIVEYLWQLGAVSIAAQVATFPLTVYYFHTFPSYFLLANLFVVPMAFVSMILGLALLSLSWIPGLAIGLGFLLDRWIFAQNWLIGIFRDLPGGALQRLTFSSLGMLWVWVMLLIWGNWEWGNRKTLVYAGLFIFLIWRLTALIQEFQVPANQVALFSKANKNLIEVKLGSRFLVWNQDFPADQISFAIDPNRIRRGVPLIPESMRGIVRDSLIIFPAFGIEYFPSQGKLVIPEKRNIQIAEYGDHSN